MKHLWKGVFDSNMLVEVLKSVHAPHIFGKACSEPCGQFIAYIRMQNTKTLIKSYLSRLSGLLDKLFSPSRSKINSHMEELINASNLIQVLLNG